MKGTPCSCPSVEPDWDRSRHGNRSRSQSSMSWDWPTDGIQSNSHDIACAASALPNSKH